jgi:hypothetical protein
MLRTLGIGTMNSAEKPTVEAANESGDGNERTSEPVMTRAGHRKRKSRNGRASITTQ